jgi:hypothetical protein
MALLGVESSDDHRAVLRGLGNGEAIFRDLDGRAGRIGVDLASDELQRWLDTNPTRSRPDEGSRPDHAAPGRGEAGAGHDDGGIPATQTAGEASQ